MTEQHWTNPKIDPETWEPGIPLYHPANGYRNYFYNFRDDASQEREDVISGDAASWPEPRGGTLIIPLDVDELEIFIAECRAARRECSS